MVEIWGIKKICDTSYNLCFRYIWGQFLESSFCSVRRFAPVVAEFMLMMRCIVDIVARNARHVK